MLITSSALRPAVSIVAICFFVQPAVAFVWLLGLDIIRCFVNDVALWVWLGQRILFGCFDGVLYLPRCESDRSLEKKLATSLFRSSHICIT